MMNTLARIARFVTDHGFTATILADRVAIEIPYTSVYSDEVGTLVVEVSTMAQARQELGY